MSCRTVSMGMRMLGSLLFESYAGLRESGRRSDCFFLVEARQERGMLAERRRCEWGGGS